jgi:uncharacterized protein DUF397
VECQPLAGKGNSSSKQNRSSCGGQCVEVRRHGGMIEVCDSKDRSGPVLRFTSLEWDVFLHGARNAEFDHLLTD